MKNRSRRLTGFFAGAALVLFASGCVYTNVTGPLDTDLQDTDLGSKVGRSEAHAVLGLVAWGDAGTRAAAKDGQITTLKHADQKLLSVLSIVYTRVTTIVYGD